MDGFGILTATNVNDSTKKLNSDMVRILKQDDVEIRTYSECGYFCIMGWKGDKLVVHAHCNDYEEYGRAMGLIEPSSDYGGGYR